MRHFAILPLVAALVLPGCGQSSDKTGAAATSGNAAAASAALDEAAFKVAPGKYRSSVNITKLDLGGLPVQVAAAMPRQSSYEYCVTPEQAAKGIEALKQQMAKGSCQFESFKASGGTVDSVFTCTADGGFAMRSVSHGTYSESGSDVSVTADAKLPGGRSMHVEQSVKAQRIGDCT
ncbi:MAG: DUF3617 domain-containing protein [Novosphingobium sp.]|uniref:DUF3617 domain-containing protein n=1 Tax=Novosphingobium sp. TaxID=1874826 RepID=UPI003C79B3AD